MKVVFIICLLTMFSLFCRAQNLTQNGVPDKVKTTYESLYPQADKTKWNKEKTNYEAKFKLDQARLSVLIDFYREFNRNFYFNSCPA